MPTAHFNVFTISPVMRPTSPGIEPPFVSQRTTMSAPAFSAAIQVASAYSGLSL
jgi:hypothetical protein